MADSLASQIITAIGGPENVRSLTHCATRLRFELADASKVDQNALEHMKGVLGAVPQSGDRFQVVIGGGVATVYENIMHLPEMANAGAASASGEGQKSNADVKAEARSKARGKVAWLDSFFEYLADSFRPILGVLLGASIIIALVNLLISLNVIPNDEASAGWVFVKAIWKGVFYFLPIMVAYNAAKKLKVDPWLGGAIMAILMTPQFTSLMDAKTTTCVENAALGTKSCTANIFGIPMALSGQCRPSGTRNGYSSGMMMAKMNGAWVFIQARPTPRPLPTHTPIGPMMKAVSAPTMIMQKNGTKTSWTLSGMILFNPW